MKRGFTLIEVITTIGLISILLAISFPSVKSFNNFKDKIYMDYAASSLVEFINGCKSYSRNKSLSARIKRVGEGEIGFYDGSKKIRGLSLPVGIKVLPFELKNNAIDIDNLGFTSDACTITLTNNSNMIRYITLKVGTWYVSEKE